MTHPTTRIAPLSFTRLPSLGILRRLAPALVLALACGSDDTTETAAEPLNPADAPRVEVDRFSEAAGTLQVRTADNGLPEAGAAINFDEAPFLTHGLGPGGEQISYYNFDVQSTETAPVYVFFREGEDSPVSGQLNVIDVIPGDPGYNDFWRVTRVVVPSDYTANTATSFEDIVAMGFAVEPTDQIVNCPVAPEGSTAGMRVGGGSSELHQGWYRDQVAYYFTFEEQALAGPSVPIAPIYVTFNINPNEDGGGPPSGFVSEADSVQTHNVLEALPGSTDYSPLWSVNVYDNAEFDAVSDLDSARSATLLGEGVASVNCPMASVEN